MPTSISNVYDAIITQIGTTLPSAAQIAEAFEIEKAPGLLLDNGYAISIGPATNLKTELTSRLRQRRQLGITLTRQAAATENAASLRGTIKKQMLEDMLSLTRAFESSTAVNATVSDITYDGDGGIESLNLGEGIGSYYVLSGVFTVDYFESLI
jgi:hypothetical protein